MSTFTRARSRALAFLSAVVLSVVFAVITGAGSLGCKGHSTAVFEHGVELESLTLPKQAVPGETIPLDFSFKTAEPLTGDWWVFVHIESSGSPNCRVVADRPPVEAPSTWHGQPFHHKVEVTMAPDCEPGTLEVYAGLYDRGTSARLRVIDPPTLDNRLPVGNIDLVAKDADSSLRTLSATDLRMRGIANLLRPWAWWALGIAAAICAAWAAGVRLRRRDRGGGADVAIARSNSAPSIRQLSPALRALTFLVPAVPLVLGILVVLEFVKDDAYISFRYAHNLVHGQGLTFNPGDRLEGFTNFLWVLILAPFEALGWDLFQVCEVLGTALSLLVLWQMTTIVVMFEKARRDLSHVWAALWVATSSSWVLWAKSGLEQPLAGLLPLVSAYLLWRAQDAARISGAHDGTAEGRVAGRNATKYGLWSGIVMGLGCMTRPEIHLMGFIVALPLLAEAVRLRRVPRVSLLYVTTLLAITIPFHAFRYLYFGSLLPNTFYVKTGDNAFVWREGLKQLHEMFGFNNIGWLVFTVPFAFLDFGRPKDASVDAPPSNDAPPPYVRLERKLTMLAISIAFMAYIVKVGVDEMQWFRLYLPAMPFFVTLSAMGLRNLCDAAFAIVGKRTGYVAVGGAWVAVLGLSAESFRFTYKELGGFNGHADLAGTYHPDLGKFLVRHERPGGLVAFQDMGSTPYHAPDIDFLDFIGLVDGTVARARHAFGLHAFISHEGQANMPLYDAKMREYFWRRDPEWAILTVYTPRDQDAKIAEAFDRNPGPEAMFGAYANNSYQFGIWGDPRFQRDYVHVRTWQRSRSYYLSLFRRRDLWEQTPGEVVLDAVPSLGGARATFANGLELLGSEITPPSVHERHEVFVTTWWRVPGPMPKDTWFFVHVNRKPGERPYHAAGDHLPGDSMYPADRWKPGQILEDRTLFQLPINLPIGEYDVNMGVYQRLTGDRAKVVSAGAPVDNRVHVGSFHVTRLWPMIDQLIPPTDVKVMRKYPERIVHSMARP